MPTSHAETPENETNSHTQNALSLDPWEAAYLRFETPEEEIQNLSGASIDWALLNGRATPKLSSFFAGVVTA